jgi:hypothetical protein
MDFTEIISNCNQSDFVKLRAAIDVKGADLSLIEEPSPYVKKKYARINHFDYEIEGFGDLIGDYNGGYKRLPRRRLHSLRAALAWLEIWGLTDKFDPEDDRVVIWEMDLTGRRKPVWHASGWHWPYDEVDGHKIEQGALNAYSKSVYSDAMKDY